MTIPPENWRERSAALDDALAEAYEELDMVDCAERRRENARKLRAELREDHPPTRWVSLEAAD